MYDELVKRLRDMATSDSNIKSNYIGLSLLQAADAIEELQQITTHYEEESKGWWLAACDAKEERERLKEQMPQWIPVTERLPDQANLVLIRHHSNTGNRFYGLDVYDGVGWIIAENVTHWMPLPEPPKGD